MNSGVVNDRRWIDWHWQAQGLGLIVLAFLSFYPGAFHYQEYLFFALLVAAVGVAVCQGSAVWVRSPVDLPVALLVGWILITIPFSIDPATSFAEWRKLVAHVLVFYWALLVLKNRADRDYWRYVIRAMLVGVATMSLYAMMVFLQEGGTLVDRSVRAVAPSSVVGWLGTYVVMMVPFAVTCYVWSKTRWEKLVLGGALCLMLVAEFFSYSRGGWLALAVMGLGFGILRGNRRTVTLAILLVAASASVLFGISQLGYLGGVFDPLTVVDRLDCWSAGVYAFLNHPIVGVGFGQDIFGQLPVDWYGRCIQLIRDIGIHNTFLMYAMGSGAFALLSLLWIFAVVIIKFTRNARVAGSNEVASVKLAGALAVLGYAVTMVSDILFSKELAHLFWMLVAIGFSLPCREGRPDHHTPGAT